MAVAFHPRAEYQAILDNATGEVYHRRRRTRRRPSLPKLGIGKHAGIDRSRHLPRRASSSAPSSPIPSSTATSSACSPTTSPWTRAPARFTPLPRTAPTTSTPAVKYGLDPTTRVDAGGHITEGLPEYDGKKVFAANEPIVELLKARGVLLGRDDIEHSYPHCWRCHKPVIFRATEQWFISMEGAINGGTLRTEALDEIAGVRWDPAWGEERISNMIATRPDWCISRQRIWGVPIAVFFCEGCGKLHEDQATNRAVIDLFAREGADAWYARPAAEIVPAGTRCAHCGGTAFRKEMDIIDVWFESGSSQASVLPQIFGHWKPADMYLEGGDQYRGWFHSSLLCSIGLNGEAPYKAVATNGWTLDENGRAMSKSLGNTVDPVDIAKRMGGEIVRFWVASVDFREDVRASENLMTPRRRELPQDPQHLPLHPRQPARLFARRRTCSPSSRWSRSISTCCCAPPISPPKIRAWYDQMLFHRIYQRLNEFFAVDLSAQYFDILKDRLYTFPRSSRERKSAQTALWRIGEALLRLVAPILSFTADEAWQFMPQMLSRPESVHLALLPNANDITGEIRDREQAAQVRADWDYLFTVRELALRATGSAAQRQNHQGQSGSPRHHHAPRAMTTSASRSTPINSRPSSSSPRWKCSSGAARLGHRVRSWQGRGRQVRALLELLHPRRRGREIPHRLRALQRQSRGHRGERATGIRERRNA